MALKRDKIQEDRLLEKAIRGDRIGLEYLVNTYKNLAYTIAIRIVSNREDAEEIVQDSFMKAFASLSKFKKASKFSTWLYRIVYNTSVTKVKGKKIATIGIDDQLNNEPYATAENREWDLLKNEERKKYVELALSRLMPEDRLVITLHYMGEKSISEVCEIMDKKKSAIKMQLLRGRKQLEGELELMLNSEMRDLL